MMVRCPECSRANQVTAAVVFPDQREGKDPYFGLPLFLSRPIAGDLIWAYNGAHAALLKVWLQAKLRERPLARNRMTMMARLPRWMKVRSARAEVIAALDKMMEVAAANGM